MCTKMPSTLGMVRKSLFARSLMSYPVMNMLGYLKDPLEAVIMDGIEIDDFENEPDTHLAVPELSYSVAQLENVPPLSLRKIWKENLERDEHSSTEKIEELKQLPPPLKYAFLEKN